MTKRSAGKHPAERTWLAFVEDSLASEERGALERHLASCRSCRDVVTAARRLVQAFGEGPLPEPSATLVESAFRAFAAARPPLPTGLPEHATRLAQRFVEVVFDAFARPEAAFAGTRSAQVARRVRFEAADLELDVLIEARGDKRRLVAQVLALGKSVHPIADVYFFV